jgi:hypothetical protein
MRLQRKRCFTLLSIRSNAKSAVTVEVKYRFTPGWMKKAKTILFLPSSQKDGNQLKPDKYKKGKQLLKLLYYQERHA